MVGMDECANIGTYFLKKESGMKKSFSVLLVMPSFFVFFVQMIPVILQIEKHRKNLCHRQNVRIFVAI